jgi:hypothetical protein
MATTKTRTEEIILEIYRQRYRHVQHLQQMRATYFNIYVAVIGFSVAAMTSFEGSTFGAHPPVATLALSMLIWIISVFSIMRSERWGGHISHDLNAVRKIQNFFARRYKPLDAIVQINERPLTSLEFDRPLWNRNRSIETPIFMIGAIISGLLVAGSSSLDLEYQAILGVLLVVSPIIIWRAEVSNLLKRHASCCLSSGQEKARKG